MAIGNTYAVDVSNGTYAPPNDGLLVEGNIGIGIDVSNNSNPQSQLDISGNVRIGASYAGNNSITTDPVNGLIVEGPVGIGTSDPGNGFLLDVSGNVRFQSQMTITDLNLNNVNLYTMTGVDQVGTINIGRSDDNTKRYHSITTKNSATTSDNYFAFNLHQGGTDTGNDTAVPVEEMRLTAEGRLGIGTTSPGTMLQIEGSEAYLTLKNSVDENGDGEAETKIIFEDHGNHSLAQIQASHCLLYTSDAADES